MLFSKALLALTATGSALAGPIFLDKRQGVTKGVNLGGWLVLEPWITPSIFDPYNGAVVDEWTLCQNVGNAAEVLQSHWASWVTLGDFQRIAGSGKGINLVRIPVGYWAFQKYPGDTYIQGAKDYLAQALDWASQTGLNVWIDLHGAPLSQNGFDNSGHRIDNPQFTTGDTIGFTAGVIGQIASEFGSHPAVAGIELVNEPLMPVLPGGRDSVTNYNYAAGPGAEGSGKAVIISDGFDAPNTWNGQFNSYIIDHHEYQVFTNDDVAMSWQEHVDQVYSRASQWGYPSGVQHNLICGEWTGAMTDCATWLNGYGIGARYDGTFSKPGQGSSYVGSCAEPNSPITSWSQEFKTATTNYIQAQLNAFSSDASGWIFWNFKTESAGEWDFFQLVDNGVWP